MRIDWQELVALVEVVKSAFEGANAAQMETSFEECGGALLVSFETKLSAVLDDEYPDLQYKAWEACVNRARCKALPNPRAPTRSRRATGRTYRSE